jgi:jasmonate O-methyltransferase
MKSSIEDAIAGILGTASTVPKNIIIADLGCSYGPNALALVSAAVNAVLCQCMQHEQPLPEVCVLLNDLPGNDFNSVAKSIAEFNQSFESCPPIVINAAMVPGSFHARLFSRESVHLVCSSISLHWLSEVIILFSIYTYP